MISLLMEVERVGDRWLVVAPWGTAEGASFEEAYYVLLKMYHEQTD